MVTQGAAARRQGRPGAGAARRQRECQRRRPRQCPHGRGDPRDRLRPARPWHDAPLGSKELEGVKVNGERTSWPIEAGNEKPIIIATRDLDPRSGEVNCRRRNLRRAEPDAALMKMPADAEQSVNKPRKPAAPPAKG